MRTAKRYEAPRKTRLILTIGLLLFPLDSFAQAPEIDEFRLVEPACAYPGVRPPKVVYALSGAPARYVRIDAVDTDRLRKVFEIPTPETPNAGVPTRRVVEDDGATTATVTYDITVRSGRGILAQRRVPVSLSDPSVPFEYGDVTELKVLQQPGEGLPNELFEVSLQASLYDVEAVWVSAEIFREGGLAYRMEEIPVGLTRVLPGNRGEQMLRRVDAVEPTPVLLRWTNRDHETCGHWLDVACRPAWSLYDRTRLYRRTVGWRLRYRFVRTYRPECGTRLDEVVHTVEHGRQPERRPPSTTEPEPDPPPSEDGTWFRAECYCEDPYSYAVVPIRVCMTHANPLGADLSCGLLGPRIGGGTSCTLRAGTIEELADGERCRATTGNFSIAR